MTDKTLKLGILVSVVVIALSFFYYLVVRPIHISSELGKCLERAEAQQYSSQKQNYRDNCFKQY